MTFSWRNKNIDRRTWAVFGHSLFGNPPNVSPSRWSESAYWITNGISRVCCWKAFVVCVGCWRPKCVLLVDLSDMKPDKDPKWGMPTDPIDGLSRLSFRDAFIEFSLLFSRGNWKVHFQGLPMPLHWLHKTLFGIIPCTPRMSLQMVNYRHSLSTFHSMCIWRDEHEKVQSNWVLNCIICNRRFIQEDRNGSLSYFGDREHLKLLSCFAAFCLDHQFDIKR